MGMIQIKKVEKTVVTGKQGGGGTSGPDTISLDDGE